VHKPELLRLTENGLYCEAGAFYIDPWRPVERAIITHAHSDHARRGSKQYLTASEGEHVLRHRLGPEADIQTIRYGDDFVLGGVRVSLHPAGHIRGSSQVRLELDGQVAVISGDYKRQNDSTCTAFEPVRCHTFVTESTFGLPIYRWPAEADVFAEIEAWWRANQEAGKASVVFAYALGKAQRILAGLDPSIGPIYTHGAVESVVQAYRASGVDLPDTLPVALVEGKPDWRRTLILAPPSAGGSTWLRRFGAISTAFASGWMQIRGTRRRRAIDRGFVLSDHVDWPGLLDAIEATGAETVWVTHGYAAVVARWLREKGLNAQALATQFVGERDEAGDEPIEEQPAP
jgi:putative mRNA 3-end processing factor